MNLDITGCENLANGIIAQCCDDYRSAIQIFRGGGANSIDLLIGALDLMRECETYLLSDDMQKLTSLDGNYILQKLNKELSVDEDFLKTKIELSFNETEMLKYNIKHPTIKFSLKRLIECKAQAENQIDREINKHKTKIEKLQKEKYKPYKRVLQNIERRKG